MAVLHVTVGTPAFARMLLREVRERGAADGHPSDRLLAVPLPSPLRPS